MVIFFRGSFCRHPPPFRLKYSNFRNIYNSKVFREVFLILKGTVSRDFLLLVFFMNQFPPSHRVSHQDRFEFFRKFAEIFASKGAPPVSTTPVANLPPVSTTPVAICHRHQRHRRQICHRCQWHLWQTVETISGCCDLKVNLRQKCFYRLTILPTGVQTK